MFRSKLEHQTSSMFLVSSMVQKRHHVDLSSFSVRWHEVAPIIVQFVEGRRRGSTHVVLFAHNARNFDVPFIVNHFNDSGVPLPSHWLFLDTVPLARDVLVAKGTSPVLTA